jgi:hypothetical protein
VKKIQTVLFVKVPYETDLQKTLFEKIAENRDIKTGKHFFICIQPGTKNQP